MSFLSITICFFLLGFLLTIVYAKVTKVSQQKWHNRFYCDCGYSTVAWQDQKFFIKEECCPKCGNNKKTFKMKTVKYVTLAKWYNPLTWWKGEMVQK